MKLITRHAMVIEHNGREYEIPQPGDVAEWMDPLVTERDDGLHVSYLAQDWDAQNPWEDDEAIEYRIFDRGYERDEWIDAHNEDPDPDIAKAMADGRFFWLERYEHGLVRYALINESSQVDRRWDVAHGVGYLILDTDWAGDLTEIARNLCDTYTSWCNGDVYGIVHVRLDPTTGEVLDEESCWGYIGSEYAEQTMKEEHG